MNQATQGRKVRANLMLLVTALIWGVAFVAQDVAMDSLPPFTFNGIRMALGGLALLPCIWLMRRKNARRDAEALAGERVAPAGNRRTLLTGGLCCGVALFLGSSLQQRGIMLTSAGKAGFVTALYIVLVPLVGLFLGKKVRLRLWLAVSVSLLGLFLLCVTEQLTMAPGDVFLIAGAVCYTGHILAVDHFAPQVDCLAMSCIQFFVTAVLSAFAALLWESPTWAGVRAAAVPILYAGVLSGAVGYTLQILGQRDTDPTVASLIMCLESVFAVLAGWLLLGDMLSPRELAGCGAMLVGIVLAQWPSKEKAPISQDVPIPLE